MPSTQNFPFQKNLLAIAIGAALTPATAWALDLVQEPPLPTSKSAFVAPNVIISIDDSGSMRFCTNAESEAKCVKSTTTSTATTNYSCQNGYTLNKSNNCTKNNNPSKGTVDNSKRTEKISYSCQNGFSLDNNTNECYRWTGATEETAPSSDGSWPVTARRMNILQYSLKTVFKDPKITPDGKIRLAWQAMWNNGGAPGGGKINNIRWSNGYTYTSNAGANNFDSTKISTNSMLPLKGGATTTGHRKNFLDFVDSLTPENGTPSHLMFSQADSYMRAKTNPFGPWATNPGGTDSKKDEYLGCRRNYHIMMTDGRWNGTATSIPDSGKRDNSTNLTLPNSKFIYSSLNSNTNLYRDKSSGSTLADWAFYSWAEPLQKTSVFKADSNTLKPPKTYDDADDSETFTNGSSTATLDKFWNPKFNPATWPHMVTYTIGFSEMAYKWDYSSITAPQVMSPFGFDGSFPGLANGSIFWPDLKASTEDKNALDLWHAALNGRGRFYAIQKGEELEQAFREIIGKINEESAPLPDKIAGGGSTSGYSVSQNNAGIYASAYSPKDGWSGYITATRAIEPEEYACPTKDDEKKICIRFPDVVAGWDGKSTADRLDALTSVNNRNIQTWSDSTGAGTPFKWTTDTAIAYSNIQKKSLLGLSTSENDSVLTSLATLGRNIVNYIRGDRSLEGTTDAAPLRVRTSRQGDTVNSEIWYTGAPISNYSMGYADFVKAQKDRTHILYVGGNDGMLHGFSAANGSEILAYVPRGVVGNLKNLTDKDYQHQYFVDGSPMTGDIKDGDNWKTMLVGSLGAGGKGYFLLDVTNPGSFAATSVVKDRTRGNKEAIDCSSLTGTAQSACTTAATEDADIGNMTSRPGRNPASLQEATQITRLNNGRWAVVMGNGYNSTNQRPVLLVQYLDGDRALKLIPATTDSAGTGKAKDNGLASPALVDLNGDGKTDVIYAGDNLGNLWKFDMTSTDPEGWKVAFDGQPLFTARGPVTLTGTTRDEIQPITAAPIARANDRSVTTGTGADTKTTAIGGMMIAFGTGRNVTENDRRTDVTQNVQTLYSVLDNTRYRMNSAKTALEVHPGDSTVPTPAVVGTMNSTGKLLAKQSIAKVTGGLKADDATITATQELTAKAWSTYKGWYMDFPDTGERLLKPMQFFDGSNILAVYSESPSGTKNSESDNINESCVPVKVDTSAGAQWRTLINIMDGKRPTIQLIDTNNDGSYNSADLGVSRVAINTGTPLLISKQNRIVDLTGGGGERDTLARMPEQSTRPSWRQVK